MVEEFGEYLRQTPPHLVAHYVLKRPPVGPCDGKGLIDEPVDFRATPHLTFFREHLATHYRLMRTFDDYCDRVDIFERVP